MKISKIHVSNVLRISDVSIDCTAPIVLVAGANEAGKSSMMDAVAYAMQGKLPRVSLKKSLTEAVHLGKENGFVEVSTDGGAYSVMLPSGKGVHFDSFALPLVMDAGRFAGMNENDRRAFLFALSGLQCNSDSVSERLIARGCDTKMVAEIAPLLRAGFPAAETEARTKVREKKAAWKAVTGGETWGKEKAAKWQPAALPPEADKADSNAEDARKKAIEVEHELSDAQQELGAARAELQRRQQAESQRAELGEQAGKIGRIKSKITIDEAELKQWEEKVKETRAKAGVVSTTQGDCLFRSLAAVTDEFLVVASNNHDIEWPEGLLHCASEHLDEYKSLYGWPPANEVHADPDAIAQLPEHERVLSLLQRSVANSKRDLLAAESAAAKLAELDGGGVGPIDLDAIQSKVNALNEERIGLRADVDKFKYVADQAKRNKEAINQASTLHGGIIAWSDIADALAPDGIPGEMLSDAIKPINDRLRVTAMTTGWDQVSIDGDMTIRINQRLYALGSLSARYRANLALVEAISYLSGLRFFAVDEFDCLDAVNRMAGLKWLHQLATSGEAETILVFGTFKQPPQAPKTFQVLWMERGEIVNFDKKGMEG